MKAYQELHRESPTRELYVLHTKRKNPISLRKNGLVWGDSEKYRQNGPKS
jgi:hypothetical protein